MNPIYDLDKTVLVNSANVDKTTNLMEALLNRQPLHSEPSNKKKPVLVSSLTENEEEEEEREGERESESDNFVYFAFNHLDPKTLERVAQLRENTKKALE